MPTDVRPPHTTDADTAAARTLSPLLRWMAAPPAAPRLPKAEVRRRYPRLRLQVFIGIFLGYAGFYLIRNNISLIAPLLLDQGRINTMGIGIIANAVLLA